MAYISVEIHGKDTAKKLEYIAREKDCFIRGIDGIDGTHPREDLLYSRPLEELGFKLSHVKGGTSFILGDDSNEYDDAWLYEVSDNIAESQAALALLREMKTYGFKVTLYTPQKV